MKEAVKSMLRWAGLEAVRSQPGYEVALFPRIGKELDPLQLAVRSMLAEGSDFFFVQIGANNGVRADPLRSLILRYHLRGLLVEPLPDMFMELKQNYASEGQLSFENAAIALQNGEITLFRFKPNSPVPDWVHGMATVNARRIRGMAQNWNVERNVEEVRVRSVTLERLLDDHQVKHMNLLQIDTEGFDLEVIRMALENGMRPDLINYEFRHLSLTDRLESYRLLAECGYRFLHGRFDTLAVRGAEQEDGHGR